MAPTELHKGEHTEGGRPPFLRLEGGEIQDGFSQAAAGLQFPRFFSRESQTIGFLLMALSNGNSVASATAALAWALEPDLRFLSDF